MVTGTLTYCWAVCARRARAVQNRPLSACAQTQQAAVPMRHRSISVVPRTLFLR